MAVSESRPNPAFVALVLSGGGLLVVGIVVAVMAGVNESRAEIVAAAVGVPHEANPLPLILGIIIAVFGAALLAAALVIRASRSPAAPSEASKMTERAEPAESVESGEPAETPAPAPKSRRRLVPLLVFVGVVVVIVIAVVTVNIVQNVQRSQAAAEWHELTEHRFDSTMDDGDIAEFAADACAEMQSNPEGVEEAYDAWAERHGYSKSEDAFDAFDASITVFCP